ncbi:MAG: glutamate-cysteine ligase family protein, partial [Chitinophagales bacterium]
MNLIYKNNERSLTLGVEMELQLIDADTLRLTPKASEFLTAIKSDKLTKEMFKSTLEIITGVCNNVHEVIDDFNDTLV